MVGGAQVKYIEAAANIVVGSGAFPVLPVSYASRSELRLWVSVRSSLAPYEWTTLIGGMLCLCSYSTTVATTESSRYRFESERSRSHS